jgi:tetratricopeptide (TPR) repeat protein
MSQLLIRLQREVQAAIEHDHRAELLARIAAIFARMRNFAEAKRIVEDLRKTYGDGRSGRVTVWIMLAEALILLFEKFSPQAVDRITRAQALGLAMKYSKIVALASAWKAHLEFENGTYGEMISSLAIALENAEDENYDANTRLAIVLCNALTICGNRTESQKWFMRARQQAAKNGDQPSIASLLYNRAAFLTTRARAENCIEKVDSTELRSVRMELESMRNFHGLTDLVALPEHIQLWDARLQMLEGEYAAAIEKLRSVRDKSPFADHNFSQAYIDLEIAYCQLRLNRMEEALAAYLAIGDLRVDQLDVDEQLVAAWMHWCMSSADPRFGDSAARAAQLAQARATYQSTMAGLSEGLQRFAA